MDIVGPEQLLSLFERRYPDLDSLLAMDFVPRELRERLLALRESKSPMVYFASPMRWRHAHDFRWREKEGTKIEALGYVICNPAHIECEVYQKSYTEFQAWQRNLVRHGQYAEYLRVSDFIKSLDLALIRISDCLVVYFPPSVVKDGTAVESEDAYRHNIPTFVKLNGSREDIRLFLHVAWLKMKMQFNQAEIFDTWVDLREHLAAIRGELLRIRPVRKKLEELAFKIHIYKDILEFEDESHQEALSVLKQSARQKLPQLFDEFTKTLSDFRINLK